MSPPAFNGRSSRIAIATFALVVLALVASVGRVAQLQLAPDPRLAGHISDRRSRIELPARRGDLLDRRGRLITTERPAFRIVVDPEVFPDPPHGAIVRLAAASGVEASEIGPPILAARAVNAERRALRGESSSGSVGDRGDAAARRRLLDLLSEARAALSSVSAPSPGVGRVASAEPGVIGPPALGEAGPSAAASAATAVGASTATRAAARARPRIIRFVPVTPIIDAERAEAAEALDIPGVSLERRPVRTPPAGRQLEVIVGKVGFEGRGLRGLELTLDERLQGRDGEVRYVRDARGSPVWIGRDSTAAPVHGRSVRLSIDLEVQRIAAEELAAGLAWADAAGGRIVVLDPVTGEVLAMADQLRAVETEPFPWIDPASPRESWPTEVDWDKRYTVIEPDPARAGEPALGRNRNIQDIYEPGSTFKPFVWAEAARRGLLPEEETIDKRPGWLRAPSGRIIRDVSSPDEMSWEQVLTHSSNIGMVRAAERLTPEELREGVLRYGFSFPTGVQLEGEAAGAVTSARGWRQTTHESVSFGHEVAVTPLQLARAFTVFARSGELAGSLADVTIVARPEGWRPYRIVNLLPAGVVGRVRTALVETVRRMDQLGQIRQDAYPEPTYRLFGKSGTAEVPLIPPTNAAGERLRRPEGTRGYLEDQYISSFIAAGPIERPRLVVLVIVEDPGPERIAERSHYGSGVAGPVVRRVMERALRYLAVEPSPAEDTTAPDATRVAVGRSPGSR